MNVNIDGKLYVLANDQTLDWGYGQVLTTPFRLSGVPSPQDNQILSRFPVSWEKGLGWARMDRGTGRGVGGLRDSTVETRFRQVTLPLLPTTTTHAAPADHLVKMMDWNGAHRGFFEEEWDSGSTTRLLAYVFGGAGDSWTAGGTIVTTASGDAARLVDVAEFSNDGVATLYALIALNSTSGVGNPGEWFLYESTNGTSWSASTNHPGAGANDAITGPTMQNSGAFTDRLGALLSDGANLLAACYEDNQSRIRVYTSTDPDDTAFTTVGTLPATDGVVGMFMWTDIDNAAVNVPYLLTRENLYRIDVASTALRAVFSPGTLRPSGGWCVASDFSLYIGDKSGDIFQLSVPATSAIVKKNIGPASRSAGAVSDGLISSRQGIAYALDGTDSRWMFAGYGGNASGEYASIFAFEYATETWHHIYLDGTDNRRIYALSISDNDDGTLRLHFSTEGTTASVTQQLEKIGTDPASGATMNYGASGVAQFAEDDGGDPNTAMGVFQAVIEADALSASTSGEYIDYKSASDGAAWGTDDRGDFLSGDKDLVFAAGAGASMNTRRDELTLHRDGGNTTDTPKVKSFEVQAVNAQKVLRQPTFPIDLKKTAEVYERTVETQIADLETIASTATQVQITVGKFAAYYAKIIAPPRYDIRIVNADRQQEEGDISGVAFVTFTQLLEGV